MATRRTKQQSDAVVDVPPENEPGHHPETEQDKPVERFVERAELNALPTRFDFEFDSLMALLARPLGIAPSTTAVKIEDDSLRIEFGLWRLVTPLSNVTTTQVTGPYSLAKVVGPPRVSLADRGITFATNRRRGLCICFRDPVPAILPVSALRHPGATVTVADPEGLAESLAAHRDA